MQNEKLLSINEAAESLGLRPSTLRKWRLMRRHLGFVQIGRSVRVRQSELQRLIAANTVPARSPEAR
jgi:excisionase family DNA binding protein